MKKINKLVALTSLSALALSLVAFRYPNREYNQQYRYNNCENGVCLYRENSDYRNNPKNNYYNRNTNYNNGHNPYCEENGPFHRHNNLHSNNNHGNHSHNGHNRHR